MSEVIHVASGKPKCPNHGCPLEGMPWPLPKKGEAICPVSGAHFAFEAETDETKLPVVRDKFGGLTKQSVWKLTGED